MTIYLIPLTEKTLETNLEFEYITNLANSSIYLLDENKYIIEMIFINTEKIEKLKWFYKENSDGLKKVEIITISENKEKIGEMVGDNRRSIKVIDKDWLGGIFEC